MRVIRRAGKMGFRAAGILGLVALALMVFLTQTPRGRELVLREVLRRIEGGVNGRISVEGISSPGLLRGFTFRDVRLTGPDGRPFLTADSIMAGVSPRALLSGDLVFTRVVVWSPEVTLERLPDGERMNVLAIFLPGESESTAEADTTGSGEGAPVPAVDSAGEVIPAPPDHRAREEGRTIALRDVRIHDGSLDILLPQPRGTIPSPRSLVEPAPSGDGWLRRYSFREVQVSLPEADLRSPGEEGERLQVEELAFLGEIRDSPFRVEELRGEIRRTPGRLLASIHEVRLPSSGAQGRAEVVWAGNEGITLSLQGETRGLDLRDLRWIEPRLPAGVARGPFGLEMDTETLALDFQGTELDLSPGRVRATGGLALGRELTLQGLRLQMEDVDLRITDPWLREPIPLDGRLGGELALEGSPGALAVDGNVTLRRAGSSQETDIRATGVLHLRDTLAVTDFTATLAPMEWGTFSSLSPLMTLQGPGALRMEANGSLATGILLSAEATHVPAGLSPSRVTATGMVRRDPEDLYLDLDVELGPVSFTTLRRDFPDLPVTGEVSGPVSVWGYLSGLTVDGRFDTSAGPLALQVFFDARNPTNRYRLDAEGEEFLLSALVPSLPKPTRITGRMRASGSGVTPDSLEGEAMGFMKRGQVGALRVDTAAVVATVHQGLLTIEALRVETGVGSVQGGGTFGISSSAPGGELTIRFESESLEGLRPFVMGETPVILENLSSLERDWLVLGGTDLDTIPTADEVALDGAVQGQATFRGGLKGFSGEGSMSFQDLRFRTEYLESGSLTFEGQGLPGDSGRIQGLLRTDSLQVGGQSFRFGELEADLSRFDGRVRISLARAENEEYRARGTFALDTLGGGRVNLDELFLRFDSVRWNLGGPTAFAWSPRGVEIMDFRLIRPGMEGMRVRVDGLVPLEGQGEFEVDVAGLRLERLARIAQIETPLEGLVNGHISMTGTAEDPRIEGTLSGSDLRYGSLSFSEAVSDARYRDLAILGEIRLSDGGREVLLAEGTVPADLRFRSGFPGIPDAPISLDIQVDSFPAAIPLAAVAALEDVNGTLSGQFHVGGTSGDLEPSGELRLRGGAVLLPALGVRYQGVEARFSLNPDARVDVEGRARSGGRADITGSLWLDPLTDPALDLSIQAVDFLAVARRDVEARLTGETRVTQSYRRPRVEGSMEVDEGVLMVEELARSAEVVDLSDPRFLDVIAPEEALRPILRASQNPFLRNLMLDMELRMTRGSWLRGQDLNVEMSGGLRVFWDRTERDLALVGELQAVRGVYTVVGRQFQVQDGTVSFQGTPGINPNLDIRALNRLNTQEDGRLDIVATVDGTLLDPRVSLSSNSPVPIAESDLVSYLIFGRPSYALASAQSRELEGAAGSLLGAAGGAGANFALGTISSRLGSVVARDFGLDFLAISQDDTYGTSGDLGLSGSVATTQVEIGQYITDDVFAALLWRPFTALAETGTGRTQFAGLRVEWRMADLWTLEGFIEDRFARSPLFRTANLAGLKQGKIRGFFFWREWGY